MNRPVGLIQHQRGAIAIIVGISIAVLVGMIGLALDLGRMFVIKTELQNAADACALAAAKELDGNSGAKIRADAAGKTVGRLNLVNFQGESAIVEDANITYSDTLGGTYNRSISDANAKYVKCSLSKSGIGMLFMGVTGIGREKSFGSQEVGAYAIASLLPSQSPCVLPLGFCIDNSPPTDCSEVGGNAGDSPDANGLCVGQWRTGKFGDAINGEFNWLDFENDGIEGNIKDQLITGYCGQITGETVSGQTGNLGESAAVAWNTRFGLYKSGNNPQYNGTPPATSDQTGYSYTSTNWPSMFGAYANFLTHRPPHDPYQGNAGTGLSIGMPPYNSIAAALAVGTTDRRIVTVPVVNCAGWGPSHTTELSSNFACVLLLHPVADVNDDVYMEYLGIAGIPGSPCPAYGLPGGGGAEVPGLVQ